MNWLKDREFFKTLLKLAIPIALQNLIASSLNMVDTIMVGQLGESAIAGVGIANQVFFLLNIILFGTYSGACIFAAQYWGKGDTFEVRKVLGFSIKLGCFAALIFTLASLLFPGQIIGLFTKDASVIEQGVPFLILNAFSYIVFAVSFCYSSLCRSTGSVKMPTVASAIALSLNTLLNYLLISGHLGFPAMGTCGAGVATLSSRILEALIIVSTVYIAKYPVAAGKHELLSFDWSFFRRFTKTASPVILHEALWSLGTTMYTFIYAHMGTEVVAAINISSNIEKLFIVLFFGISNATAIIVGHNIGANKLKEAHDSAAKLLILSPAIAVVMGLLLLVSSKYVLLVFNVSAGVKISASQVLVAVALLMPIRMLNWTLIVGISRSGGDTKFSMLVEILPMWFISIPLVAFTGLYLTLPIVAVYSLTSTEEVIKSVLGIRRFLSRKWIHNVTHA